MNKHLEIRWLTAFIDRPAATFDASVAFWAEITASSLSAPRGDNHQFATLLPQAGDAYLRVQRSAEGPRVHLDLHVEDVDAARDLAEQHGAKTIDSRSTTIMTSPGGFVFCLVAHHGESSVPPPVSGVQLSRVNQLSIDIPPSLYERESAFWSGLTGWNRISSDHYDEFTFLDAGPHLPLRVLLQRLGTDHVGDRAEAHLDIGCGPHKDAMTAAHAALGATAMTVGQHWNVMKDPSGSLYCLTSRDP